MNEYLTPAIDDGLGYVTNVFEIKDRLRAGNAMGAGCDLFRVSPSEALRL